jgi:hypothetical protein
MEEKKCKNIDCFNSTENNKKYCSLRCRNIYVNKYCRDYSLNGAGLSKKHEYVTKKCFNCNAEILYENRHNTYCSNSCSAKITNIGKKHSENSKLKISAALVEYYSDKKVKYSDKKVKYYCISCNKEVSRSGRKYCSKNCYNFETRKNMSNFKKYKLECKFKFSISQYPAEFESNLIKEFGWYKPTNRGNNLNGVSRDHIYSIAEGFQNNVDPNFISHPANCRIITQRENSSKWKKSLISLEELMIKITQWDLKYNILIKAV